jgi:hypothetical protein
LTQRSKWSWITRTFSGPILQNTKNILRWIALLPGAFAAMILANIINAQTVGVFTIGLIDECSKAWFGSLAFVLAAYYIAPKGKVVTAIVVATAYCAIGTFAVVIDLRSDAPHHPFWTQIITVVLSIVASVAGCGFAYCWEKDKISEKLKESQRN